MPDNTFQRLYELGYTNLVPLIPIDAAISPRSSLALRMGRPGAKDPRGKAPGVPTPAGWTSLAGWSTHATTAADLKAWHDQGCDVGLRMGDGLYGFDVDTVDPELSATAWWTLCKVIPGAHARRVGRAPKFAVLLRIAGAARVPFKMVEFGCGPDGKPERIEGLSTGKQIKLHGLHPVTRQPYTWDDALPARNDLVEATPQQIDELFAALAEALPAARDVATEGLGRDRTPEALRGDAEMIEAAVARLPNTTQHFPTRESYRDVGYAIKGAIADERRAFDCFVSWSDRWLDDPEGNGNVEGYAEAIWKTLHPRRLGASWLLERLEATTGQPIASHWFAEAPAAAPSIWDQAPDAIAADGAALLAGDVVWDDRDANAARAVDWLIKKLFPRVGVSLLWGQSGSGKSFVGLEIAACIIAGGMFFGHRTKATGGVLFALGEGSGAMPARMDALRAARFGGTAPLSPDTGEPMDLDRLPIGWLPVSNLENEAVFRAFDDRVRAAALDMTERHGVELRLLVVDTVVASFGFPEDPDASRVTRAMKHLDALAQELGLLVIAVHHAGKTRSAGEHGSYAWRGFAETSIEVAAERSEVTGEVEARRLVVWKNRHEGNEGWTTEFVLDVVKLGIDEDGEIVTSCVVRPPAAGAARVSVPARGEASGREVQVLASLDAAASMQPGGAGARLSDICDSLMRCGLRLSRGNVRTLLGRMLEKRLVAFDGQRWRRVAVRPAVDFDAPPTVPVDADVFG